MQRTFYVIRIADEGYISTMAAFALTDNWCSAIKFASKKAALDSLQFREDEYEKTFEDIYGGLVHLRQGEAEIVKITVNMELV